MKHFFSTRQFVVMMAGLLVALAGDPHQLYAQQGHTCGFDHVHAAEKAQNSRYARQVRTFNERLLERAKTYQKYSSKAQVGPGRVYTIPVVVHVVHDGVSIGSGSNISKTQINSAIQALNEMARKKSGTHGDASGVDTRMEFALARRTPQGDSTDGILRVDGSSVTNYAQSGLTRNNEQAIKALSRWPNDAYLNIWTVTEIDFNAAGFAYFPGAGPEVDGIVMDHTYFGTTGNVNSFSNLNTTLTHEVGHYLNLLHTFEGDNGGAVCPPNQNCLTDNDQVCDTEPHTRGRNCPQGDSNQCVNDTFGLVIHNYMSYYNQNCRNAFTAGQRSRMRDALELARPSLIYSLGDEEPDTTQPAVASCTPTTSDLSNNFRMGILRLRVNRDSFHVTSGWAVRDSGYKDNTVLYEIRLADSLRHVVEVGVGFLNDENVEAYIDYNNDGDFLDPNENIASLSAVDSVDTFGFRVPGFAPRNTPLRLRLVSDWVNNTVTGPCYSPQYGQVEDFAVVFQRPDTSADTLAPQVRAQAADTLYLNPNGQATAFADSLDAGSTDNVGIDSLYLTQSDFDCADTGTATYYLVALDSSANADSAALMLTVADTSSPVARPVDTTLYLGPNGQAGLTASLLGAASTDNCQVDSLALSQDAFSCADLGTNQIVLTAFDAAGNRAAATASVTVIDTLAPTLNGPEEVERCADSVFFEPLKAEDNCVASLRQAAGPSSGDSLAAGQYTVVWEAVDSALNRSTDSFQLTVHPLPVVDIGRDTLLLANIADTVPITPSQLSPEARLLWSNGDTTATTTPIPSDLSETFYLTATSPEGCTATDSIYTEVLSVGLSPERAPEASLRLYPNPSQDRLTLESKGGTRIAGYRLLTLDGKLLRSQPEIARSRRITIPVQALAPGMYLLEVETLRGSARLRFVKRR